MPNTSSSETFARFVSDWFLRHRQFVQHLAHFTDETTITPVEEQTLVSHFFSHCLQYYNEKSAAVSVAGDDVYDFFSPPWLSSYEKLILWIGGFKPGMVFKLITTSVHDLTREQQDQLESIQSETKRRERDLNRGFALLQQSVADPPMMVPAKHVEAISLGGREESEMDAAMEVFSSEMKMVMKNADQLRCSTC